MFWPNDKKQSGEFNSVQEEIMERRVRRIVREEIERMDRRNMTASELAAYREELSKCKHCGK